MAAVKKGLSDLIVVPAEKEPFLYSSDPVLTCQYGCCEKRSIHLIQFLFRHFTKIKKVILSVVKGEKLNNLCRSRPLWIMNAHSQQKI